LNFILILNFYKFRIKITFAYICIGENIIKSYYVYTG
jgi:hypothetical protein